MEGKRSRHNIWVSARIACKAAMNVIQEILFEGLRLEPRTPCIQSMDSTFDHVDDLAPTIQNLTETQVRYKGHSDPLTRSR
jgi:hypothetical protein